jgi:hypothetical protein
LTAPLAARRPDFTLRLSGVKNTRDVRPRRLEDSWPDFAGQFRRDRVRVGDKDGTAFIFATFGDKPDGKGHLRHGRNVRDVTALVLDLDEGRLTETDLRKRLEGLTFLAHTTYSHEPESPRWRVIVPLARPLRPGLLPAAIKHFAEGRGLAGAYDKKCIDPARLYFVPRVPSRKALKSYRCVSGDGALYSVPEDALPASERRPETGKGRVKAPSGVTSRTVNSWGPYDAQAAVVELNKQGGLSHGKVTRCLESLFGIPLSRGGSVHTVLRAASRCEPAYEGIRRSVGKSEWVVPDETGWRVGGHPAWLHTLVGPEATAYVIDPTRSGDVAEAILGLDYDGTMTHDGWSPYDQFENARHQQCLNHLLRRADEMAATATRGAVRFPRRVAELLRAGLDLRDRHAAGEISRHGLAVARGRLENQLSDLILPAKRSPANERLAQHLWAHRDDLFTFLRQPGLGATNWRAELAVRFGVILRKVWGGSRTWAGARAQAVLMSVWRTCWQQRRSALDFLSQLLWGAPAAPALPP